MQTDAVQPDNDGQAAGKYSFDTAHRGTYYDFDLKLTYILHLPGTPLEDKVGLGKPTENPWVLRVPQGSSN